MWHEGSTVAVALGFPSLRQYLQRGMASTGDASVGTKRKTRADAEAALAEARARVQAWHTFMADWRADDARRDAAWDAERAAERAAYRAATASLEERDLRVPDAAWKHADWPTRWEARAPDGAPPTAALMDAMHEMLERNEHGPSASRIEVHGDAVVCVYNAAAMLRDAERWKRERDAENGGEPPEDEAQAAADSRALAESEASVYDAAGAARATVLGVFDKFAAKAAADVVAAQSEVAAAAS